MELCTRRSALGHFCVAIPKFRFVGYNNERRNTNVFIILCIPNRLRFIKVRNSSKRLKKFLKDVRGFDLISSRFIAKMKRVSLSLFLIPLGFREITWNHAVRVLQRMFRASSSIIIVIEHSIGHPMSLYKCHALQVLLLRSFWLAVECLGFQ